MTVKRRGGGELSLLFPLALFLVISLCLILFLWTTQINPKILRFFNLKKCCYLNPTVLSCGDRSRERMGKKSHITPAPDQPTELRGRSSAQMVFWSCRWSHWFEHCIICLSALVFSLGFMSFLTDVHRFHNTILRRAFFSSDNGIKN